MVGQTISHYKILEKLGEGGMGVVYKAEDTKLGRTVALKFLAPHLVRDPEARKRFEREARAAASLDHPNICMVFEVDEAGDKTFIALAFLEGRTLSKKIAEGPLQLPEALSVAMQVAEGLGAAHAKGIVHRDLKPDNAMLLDGSRGLVKILDFGLAQLAGTSKLTRGGATLGTLSYMSPEQAQGGAVDHRTDIWALGAMLYEMVAGRPPFKGDFDQAVVYSILNEPPEPLTTVRTGVPKELERIVNKCLAKKPTERYQHAEDLLVDLAASRNQLELGKPAPFRPPQSRRPWPWIAATVACGAVAAAGWWLLRSGASQPPPPQYTLSQITRDTGYTGQPALSLDGRLLAYASDRAGGRNLDIWVQQLGGGDPIRLTTDPADDTDPSFSPDGNRIVFRSDRDGGAIYVIPALGGTERRIADGVVGTDGRIADVGAPRFSPDGNWISFSRFAVSQSNQWSAQAFVAPASGGPPRPIETNLARFTPTAWSPDGQLLLGVGSSEPGEMGREGEGYVWSLAPFQGGEAAPLNKRTQRGLFRRLAVPRAWLADGNWVIFGDDAGGVRNLWRIQISPRERRLLGEPQRLTAGTGEEAPSASRDGRIAFVSATYENDIWALPLDSNRAEALAELRKVTSDLSENLFPSPSADGRKLVYTSDRSGNRDIWLRNLETGQDTPLTVSPADEYRGVISPDGTHVAFARGEQGQSKVYVLEIGRGSERLLLEDIGIHTSWTPSGKAILYYTASPIRWKTVDIESEQKRDLGLEHSQFPVHSVQFSPDEKWASFKLQGSPRTRLYVSPLIDGEAADESRWVLIAESGNSRSGYSWWPPDGNTLYFRSDRDGFDCIWAQPLEPVTKDPAGPLRAVQHFHARLQPPAGSLILGMTANLLFLPLGEAKANIWLAEPQAQQ